MTLQATPANRKFGMLWLAPGVTIANDLYPGSVDSGKAMAGPLIREGAQIGVDLDRDRERFVVSDSGVVIIGKGQKIDA